MFKFVLVIVEDDSDWDVLEEILLLRRLIEVSEEHESRQKISNSIKQHYV